MRVNWLAYMALASWLIKYLHSTSLLPRNRYGFISLLLCLKLTIHQMHRTLWNRSYSGTQSQIKKKIWTIHSEQPNSEEGEGADM